MKNKLFSVGDEVFLRKDSEFACDPTDKNNPLHVKGIVELVEDYESFDFSVRWSNGGFNSYNEKDLMSEISYYADMFDAANWPSDKPQLPQGLIHLPRQPNSAKAFDPQYEINQLKAELKNLKQMVGTVVAWLSIHNMENKDLNHIMDLLNGKIDENNQ